MLIDVGIHCGSAWWGAPTIKRVEDLGFDSFWTGEHILYHRPIHDAVTVLAAAAAATSRIRLGSAVLLLGLRPAPIIAKELASLDIIASGRLVVGVGAGGEFAEEFEACGIPLEKRGARVEEAIAVLRRYWSGERFDFAGKFFTLHETKLDLLPAQTGGPPIWIGGRSRIAQERAGRVGEGYFPYLFTPEQCREAFATVRDAAVRAGRDTKLAFPLQQYLALGPRGVARTRAIRDLSWRYNQDFENIIDKYCVCGTASEIAAELIPYIEAGVTHLVLTPIVEDGGVISALEEIAGELLPILRSHV